MSSSTSSTDRSSGWLVAGRVGRAHGLDGSFYVTRPRGALLEVGLAVRVGDRTAKVLRRSGTEDKPIVRLDLTTSREDVEALRGTDLEVARADAPPLGEDEWYAEDLEGLRVADGDLAVGTVTRLMPLPSCEVLEVARAEGGDLLVPLVADAVRSIDLEAGVVQIDLEFLGETA